MVKWLVATNALLEATRERLILTERAMHLPGNGVDDSAAWHDLGMHVANYYRTQGQLLRRVQKLDERLNRCWR
jgi:hypothetical protein